MSQAGGLPCRMLSTNAPPSRSSPERLAPTNSTGSSTMFDSEQTVVWRLIFYKRKIKCGRNCGRTRVVTTRPIEKFGYFNQKEKGMIKEVSTPVVLTEAELDAVAAGVKQEGLVNV